MAEIELEKGMDLNVKFQLPGEKLLEKLWDSLDKGICNLLQPWQQRRVGAAAADTKVYEMFRIAEAEQKIKLLNSMQIESFNLKHNETELSANIESIKIEPELNLEKLEESISKFHLVKGLKEEINVAKAVLHAESALKNSNVKANDTPLDEDWLLEWRDKASRFSDEKLQEFWGRVLAGETEKPGTFSVRTLEYLKTLSKSDADLIAKVAPFVVENRIGIKQKNILEMNGVTFNNLLYLEDIGFLNGVTSERLTVKFPSFDKEKYQKWLFCKDKVMILDHEDANKIADLNVYGVTLTGVQVLNLCNYSANVDYLEHIGKHFAKCGFKVTLADLVSKEENPFAIKIQNDYIITE